MNNRLLEVKVDDGKYTIYQEENGHVWADRYDEKKWLDVTMTPGGNMILAMAQEIDRLRELKVDHPALCGCDRCIANDY